jgi:hypothetical protein
MPAAALASCSYCNAGSRTGAEATYRRAAERDDPSGAFNLGGLLAETNDLRGAAAAYAVADELSHPSGASVEPRSSARAGRRPRRGRGRPTGVPRSDPAGPFNLGTLMKWGDVAAAAAASRRAYDRGHPQVAEMAQGTLSHLRAEA